MLVKEFATLDLDPFGVEGLMWAGKSFSKAKEVLGQYSSRGIHMLVPPAPVLLRQLVLLVWASFLDSTSPSLI